MGRRKTVRYETLTEDQQTLVTDNVRLAYNRAWCWARGRAGDDDRLAHEWFDEFRSAALHGLCIAASRFDPTRGFKFSTCAWFWIRQCLMRCTEDLHPIGPLAARRKFSGRIVRAYTGIVDERVTLEVADKSEDGGPCEGGTDLEKLLALLPDPRHRHIVSRHFRNGATYSEIGLEVGVTRQRIEQIMKMSLARLRREEEAWRAAEAIFGTDYVRGI